MTEKQRQTALTRIAKLKELADKLNTPMKPSEEYLAESMTDSYVHPSEVSSEAMLIMFGKSRKIAEGYAALVVKEEKEVWKQELVEKLDETPKVTTQYSMGEAAAFAFGYAKAYDLINTPE